MTGAETINCGYGGLAASKEDKESIGLDGVLDVLLSDKKSSTLDLLENENVQTGIKDFWEKIFSAEEEKLIFFVSFGINDYAIGRPVYNDSMDEYCYAGALAQGIERLREAYPKAQIILMTPNYVEIFEHGGLDNSGKGFVFTDFVEAVRELADKERLEIVDVFENLGITAENTSTFLADGCHPGYYGRYKIGELIWESLILQ
jgi:lysophospholipase L1-like esterase